MTTSDIISITQKVKIAEMLVEQNAINVIEGKTPI
jgi:uncharacterized protein YerC